MSACLWQQPFLMTRLTDLVALPARDLSIPPPPSTARARSERRVSYPWKNGWFVKNTRSVYTSIIYIHSLWKLLKKSLIFDSKSNNKTFWYFWRENSNSIFKQKKATVGFEVWRENSNMNIFSDIWIFAPKIKNKTIWYFWRENSNFIFEPKKHH